MTIKPLWSGHTESDIDRYFSIGSLVLCKVRYGWSAVTFSVEICLFQVSTMTIIELMVVRLRMFNWLQLILHIVKWEDLKRRIS